MVSKMKIMGYTPHARENGNRDVDLRESGWIFCRLGSRRVIARVEFGTVHEVYCTNFDMRLSSSVLRYGMGLDAVSSATSFELDVADFVTSDVDIARTFLAVGVDVVLGSMFPRWTACQLAHLLVASRLCGEFEVPPSKARPIL